MAEPVPSETSSSPVDHVPLHTLCDHCQAMGLATRTETTWQYEVEDTAAALLARSEHCHLCTMLLTDLDPDHSLDSTYDSKHVGVIYFNARRRTTPGPPWDTGKKIIQVDIFTKIFHRSGSTTSIVLVPYNYNEKDKFEGHLCSSYALKKSEYSAARLQRWLQTCIREHSGCSEFQRQCTTTTERPSRIIQIEEDRIKVQCDGHTWLSKPYVTLSHMWGTEPSERFKLKETTLRTFEAGVAIEDLPPIFKEAVKLTRILGYAHLWIDSLCILQDSSADWEEEAPKMASIYGNAVCGLACIFPPNQYDPDRRLDARASLPCVLNPAMSQEQGLYAMRGVIYSRSYRKGFACKWHKPATWPLFSRAWTFQENFLSPRTIFFGHKSLIIECSESSRDEWLGPLDIDYGNSVAKSQFFNELSDIRQQRLRPDDPFAIARELRIWHRLVNDYRSRRLTNPEDRVMAFAGMARAAQSLTQLSYVAGMWEEHLTYCLLWRVQTRGNSVHINDGHVLSREFTAHSIPSWSWFCVSTSPVKSIELNFMEPFDGYAYLGVFDINWAEIFPIYRPKEDHDNQTRYHDFIGLHITLSMWICPATVLISENSSGMTIKPEVIQHFRGKDEDHSSDAEDNEFKFHSDGNGLERQLPPLAHLGLICDYKSSNHQRLAGLCLVENYLEGTWRRAGMWIMKIRRRGLASTVKELEGLERRSVTII